MTVAGALGLVLDSIALGAFALVACRSGLLSWLVEEGKRLHRKLERDRRIRALERVIAEAAAELHALREEDAQDPLSQEHGATPTTYLPADEPTVPRPLRKGDL